MADEHSATPTVKKASPPTQSKNPSPKHKFEGHTRPILNFVFLHDNKHIVSGSLDGTMRKWDCETGLLVGEPWEGKGGEIWALALSPNGNIIACGRNDGSVQQSNTDGKMIKDVWMGYSKMVWSLSWSPSGAHIASGSEDGTILSRRAGNGKVEVDPIKTGQNWVRSLAYSPSGDRIASGGYNTICIWDSNTGQLLVGPIKDLGTGVRSVVWSSDSSKLVLCLRQIRTCFRQCLRHTTPSLRAQHLPVFRRTFTQRQCPGMCGRSRYCRAMGHRVLSTIRQAILPRGQRTTSLCVILSRRTIPGI